MNLSFENADGRRCTHVGWSVALMGFYLALGLVAGCEDVRLNWEIRQPASRPAGPPVGRSVDQPSNGTADNSAHTPRPARTDATSRQMSSEAPPLLNLYQLVLLSEPGPADAPAGFKHVRLSKAKARDVANFLMACYVPSGPSGTDQRYTLVYPTPLEQGLAAEAAALLDVPAATGEPAVDALATNIWHYCVAEAFIVLNQPAAPAVRAQRLAERFQRIMSSAELSRSQRWMAAMLAGEVLTNRAYDYAAADRAYEQARQVAEPGSYEQMSALYARSRAYVQDGRRNAARQMCEIVIGQFSTLRCCEAYERARNVLAVCDKADRR